MEEAVCGVAVFNARDEEEALEIEISQLESELAPLRREVQLLARRHARLESHLQSAKRQNARLDHLLASRQDFFSKSMRPRFQHRITQLDHVALDLKSCTHQLKEFFASAVSNAGSTVHSAPFVSTSSWTDYHHAEEQYSKQVRMYMRRLIANPDAVVSVVVSGGAPVVGAPSICGVSLGDQHAYAVAREEHFAGEKSRYDWLRVADPKLVRFRGVDAETHARQSTELARLRELFVPSECAKTSAAVELARRTAEIETLKLQLLAAAHHQAHPPHSIVDESKYKQKARELTKKQQRLRALLSTNLEILLPELYQDLAKLQSTPILWADYNLKLSRLHLQRVKVDLVITSLLKQRSKSILLSRVLNDEKRQHILLHRLISSMQSETKQVAESWRERNDILHQRALHPPTPPQYTQLKLISQLLDAGFNFQPSRLATVAIKVGEARRSCANAQLLRNKETEEAHRITERLERLRTLLFKESSGKQPILASPQLAERCRRMDSATVALASAMESLLRDFTTKSKAISELPRELQFERNMWLYFFGGRSDIIKAATRDLQGKIQTAKTVSSK